MSHVSRARGMRERKRGGRKGGEGKRRKGGKKRGRVFFDLTVASPFVSRKFGVDRKATEQTAPTISVKRFGAAPAGGGGRQGGKGLPRRPRNKGADVS